jgi:hypothetical protein
LTLAGILSTANGGLGANMTAGAIGAIPFASSTTAYASLADVAAGSYLRSGGVGAAPLWSILVLPNAATTGDMLYATSANTIGNLADVATGSAMISGGVGVAPLWGKISLASGGAVSGILPVLNGGTGASSAATARTNLSAAASGANSDITSLSGLTTPLSISQGGTNATGTPTAGAVAYGTGSAYAFNTTGTAGQVLQSGGAGAPTWGSGISGANYLFSYDTTTQTVAVANTWQALNFSTNAQIDGWTHTVGTNSFTCNQTGLYRVTLDAEFFNNSTTNTATPTGETRALFNAVEVPGSAAGLEVRDSTSHGEVLSSSFILNCATTGQALTTQFTGAFTTIRVQPVGTHATTNISATIIITRMK